MAKRKYKVLVWVNENEKPIRSRYFNSAKEAEAYDNRSLKRRNDVEKVTFNHFEKGKWNEYLGRTRNIPW